MNGREKASALKGIIIIINILTFSLSVIKNIQRYLQTIRATSEVPQTLLLTCRGSIREGNKGKNLLYVCMNIHTYFLRVHQGRTVTLKLKTSGFEVKQRSMSFPTPVDSFTDIHKAARTLLETEMKNNTQLKLRLMGMSSFPLRYIACTYL